MQPKRLIDIKMLRIDLGNRKFDGSWIKSNRRKIRVTVLLTYDQLV